MVIQQQEQENDLKGVASRRVNMRQKIEIQSIRTRVCTVSTNMSMHTLSTHSQIAAHANIHKMHASFYTTGSCYVL